MKRASILKHLLALIALTTAASPNNALGAEIIWYNIYEDTLLNSSASVDNPNPIGDQRLDATFSFEIGTFGGFIPTYANIGQWAANWQVFDRANESNAGWDAPNSSFVGTDHLDTTGQSTSPFANPADVFVQGERIYLWVFNSKDLVPTSEWALVTDATVLDNVGSAPWVMPDPADTVGSYELLLRDANEAVIGGVNGVRGPGDYTYAAPPNVSNPNTTNGFTIQTAVVPEPGSALLVFTSAAAFLARRTRQRFTRGPVA